MYSAWRTNSSAGCGRRRSGSHRHRLYRHRFYRDNRQKQEPEEQQQQQEEQQYGRQEHPTAMGPMCVNLMLVPSVREWTRWCRRVRVPPTTLTRTNPRSRAKGRFVECGGSAGVARIGSYQPPTMHVWYSGHKR